MYLLSELRLATILQLEFWWITSTVGELKVCKEPSCPAIPPVQQGILNIGIKLLLGHSMSNQHKKILASTDLNENWFLHSVG